MKPKDRIQRILYKLYGNDVDPILTSMRDKLENFRIRNPDLIDGEFELTEKDVILITYGDQFQEIDRSPLRSLVQFLEDYLSGVVSIIHILPFYPYSSDDGFSVIDYRQVNPEFGNWKEISQVTDRYHMMFDLVINHVSRQSEWFKAYIRQEEPYCDYFIDLDPQTDLSNVFRPRSNPLLTPFETTAGTKYLWTTFSDDQIDLNFANSEVLLEIIDVLLFYVEKSAQLIRLDAIGYVWKEPTTTSLNLSQAHQIVKLFRAILDEVAPAVKLITETNVPHEENIAYFGGSLGPGEDTVRSSGDEAQLVYNFSLAPLVLHSFHTSDSRALSSWANTLTVPHPSDIFLNFIASHDGIGVMPARGLLSETEIEELVKRTLERGGQVSYKSNPDGSRSVYELNITLFDALNDPQNQDQELSMRRFLASQIIMLSLAGVPGIYVHSLFGSRNCLHCFDSTGHSRSINREKFDLETLVRELENQSSLPSRIFNAYTQLLIIRRAQPAFHPNATQSILDLDPRLFCILRSPSRYVESILCLINVSSEEVPFRIDPASIGAQHKSQWNDLINDRYFLTTDGCLDLTVGSYQALWLKPEI